MQDYFSFTEKLFNLSKIGEKPEVLKGIRVLDLSHVILGPNSVKLLAQFGAEVIKVETPHYGDMWRHAAYWGRFWKGANPSFLFINENKYFVTIDLKLPRGKELVHKLAEKSDVVVENFAAGTAEAWGVGYTKLSKINPKIIYLSLSTYGQFGPMRFYPGWDALAQSASGAVTLSGYPGTDKYYKLPDYLGDFGPAALGAVCVLVALYHRQKTGKGQYIDLSQSETLMRILPNYTYSSITGEELERSGNVDPAMAPSGIFKARDGKFIALAIATDEQFGALCQAMNRGELAQEERFKQTFERLKPQNAEELDKIVEEWISSDDAERIISLANERGFPAAEVMEDLQISNDEWRRRRGSVILFNDEMYGEFATAGAPTMLSKSPGRVKWLARPLGYHNRYVFKKLLDLSEEEIKKLEKEKVIGYWDERVGANPPVYYDIEKDPIFNYQEE